MLELQSCMSTNQMLGLSGLIFFPGEKLMPGTIHWDGVRTTMTPQSSSIKYQPQRNSILTPVLIQPRPQTYLHPNDQSHFRNLFFCCDTF